jgi:hypothetical protein
MKPIEPLPDENEILARYRCADLAILTASAASQSAQAFEPLENLLYLLDQDQTLSHESAITSPMRGLSWLALTRALGICCS